MNTGNFQYNAINYLELELRHRHMVAALRIIRENLEHSVSKEVLRGAIVNTAWEIAGIGSEKTAYAIIDAVLGMEFRSEGITPQTAPPVETCEPCKRTVKGMQSCCPFHPETRKKQPTVREINAHLNSSSAYCYVRGQGYAFRIARAKTQDGVVMGRVICGTRPVKPETVPGPDWEPIPVDAEVELS